MEIGLPGGTVRPPVRSFAERDLGWVGLRVTKRPGGPPDYGIGTWDASSWGTGRSMRTGRKSELAVSLVPRQRTAAVGGFAVLTPGKRKTGELLAPAGQLSTGAEKVNHLVLSKSSG